MLPQFLQPETVERQDGVGAEIRLDETCDLLALTLGITLAAQDVSLEVSVQGSSDAAHWRPLAAFPPKFYCGVYSLKVDLAGHDDIRVLRADWKLTRRSPQAPEPRFGFYLRADRPARAATGD